MSVFVSSSKKIIRDFTDELPNSHLHIWSVQREKGKKVFTLKWVIENPFGLMKSVIYSSSAHQIRFGETLHRLRISRQTAKSTPENPDRPMYLLLGLTPSLGESTHVNFSILGTDEFEIQPDGNCPKAGWQIPNRKCYVELVESRAFEWLPMTVLCRIAVNEYEEKDVVIEKSNYLLSDMQRLMRNGAYSDMTVEVDGRTFNVHRAILSARSPVFRAMFENDMKEKSENRLVVTDFSYGSFGGLIQYLYTGRTMALTTERAIELLSLADKYNVPDLQLEVEDYLYLNIEVDNAICILFAADAHHSASLKGVVISFIGKHLGKVINSADWSSMRRRADLLEDLVKYFS